MKRLAASVVVLGAAGWAHAGVNTWTAIGPEGGDVREVVLHPTQPDTAFAIAYSGFYRTTNGALSWTPSAQQFLNPPYDVQLDPSDPDRLYVYSFSTQHIMVSTDGGVSFGPLPSLPVASPIEPRLGLGTGGVVYFAAGLRVFHSDNRGASWIERAAIALPDGARIRWLVVDPFDSNTVYAAAEATAVPLEMFVSRDGAATWTRLARAVSSLVPSPLVSGELWSAQSDGLWRSRDYAATWTNVGFATGVFDVALTANGGDLDVVASTYYGAFRSLDGGHSWADITGDLELGVRRVTAHPLYPDRIVFSGSRGVTVPGTRPGTWVARNAGIIATQIQRFTADATTDRIYAFTGETHASTGGAGYLTLDGRPLAAVGSRPPPTLVTTIHAQPGSLLALLSVEVARSNDGGVSWNLIPDTWAENPPQLWQLASAAGQPANLIAAGHPGAFRSANGGATWTRIRAGLPDEFSTFDIEFAESDPSVVYFGPYNYVSTQPEPQTFGVYRSTDGGTTWVTANGGIANLGAYDIEVDPTDSRIVYAIAGTAFVKSTDSGSTWRTLRPSLSYFARIAIDPVVPRVVYIVYGENSVLRSVDGGESFETMRHSGTRPWWNPRSVVVDPRRSHVVNVGTGGFGVQQLSVEPDLELRLAPAVTTVAPNAAFTYTVFATNRGPFASSGSSVSLQWSAGLTSVAATSQGGTCTAQLGSAVCTLNPLAVNASIGVTLTGTAPSSGQGSVSASVRGDQPDPVATNNAAAFTIDVSQAPTPTPSPPPSSGGGGGGGGGGMSLLLLLLAAWLGKAARVALSGDQRDSSRAMAR